VAGFSRFGTFFIVPKNIERHIADLGVPRVWRLATRPDPTKRHSCDSHGRISAVRFGPPGSHPRTKRSALALQIVILSHTSETAERVASLIRAGTLLGYPDLTKYPDVVGVYSIEDATDIGKTEPFRSRFRQYDGAAYGCHAAAASWKESALIYALEKYRFSLELDSFTPHSAHPRYGRVFPQRYREETYHVAAAFAIVAAFSVIEELGLEVRSSQQNPRFVGPGKNSWNPKVLADIEARLRAANIDPNATDIWVRRGAPTQVEREMKPKLGKPTRWNRAYGVRDRTLRLPDAIHYASWLRNFVAAHKFVAMTSAISPYDVHNVQSIARRLLLGRLGLWKLFV
jgi:hypothetical protein